MRTLLAVAVMAALVWLSQPGIVCGHGQPDQAQLHMGFNPAAVLDVSTVDYLPVAAGCSADCGTDD